MKKYVILIIGIFTGIFSSCKEDEKALPALKAGFNADKQEISVGESVKYTDESLGNPVNQRWIFDGGTPASSVAMSPLVKYETPGVYSVKLTVFRNGVRDSLIQQNYITVGYPDVTADFLANKTSANNNDMIEFTDLSTGMPTAWAWEFIPQDGETITSSEQNPRLKFPVGVYTVKLTASNPDGQNTKVKDNYLTVIDADGVAADFTFSHSLSYTGGEVQFTDASLGRAEVWEWTFEGASVATSSEKNPKVEFTAAGLHKITLKVSNDKKESVKEKEIRIIPGTGLIAAYLFEGDADDIGPNQINGRVRSAAENSNVSFTDAGHRAGTTTATLSNQGYIQVDNHAKLNAIKQTDYTFSCWFKTSSTAQMALMMNSGGGKINNVTIPQTWFRLNNATNNWIQFVTEGPNGSTWCQNATLPGSLGDGKWHHAVCARNGWDLHIYVDGVKVATGAGNKLVDVSDEISPFLIGAMATNGDGNESTGRKAYFTGSIDDVILYDRLLTDEEIQLLFEL